MQVDQIDWYDFVVVEKIDLYDDEEMKLINEAEAAEQRQKEIEAQQKLMIMQQIEENEQLIANPIQEAPPVKQKG